MFFVFNKEKITAYVVSILTVCFLFVIASNIPEKDNTKQTSVKVQVENNTIKNENVNNTVRQGNTNEK